MSWREYLIPPPPDAEPRTLTLARMRELLAHRRRLVELHAELKQASAGPNGGPPPVDDLPGGYSAFAGDFYRMRLLGMLAIGSFTEEFDEAAARGLQAKLVSWANDAPDSWPPKPYQVAQMAALTPEELLALRECAAEVRALLYGPRPTAQIQRGDPEARAWLAAAGPAPLAGNRFGDAAEARAFVEELYAAGAERVVVASEAIREEEEGLYADALRVQLPRKAAPRRAVFAIVNREVEEEGLDPYEDKGQPSLYLWWD